MKCLPRKTIVCPYNKSSGFGNGSGLGAPWPEQVDQDSYLKEERAKPVTDDGILVKTSGGLSEDWTYRRYKPEDMWAFKALERPEFADPGLNPIDSFVRAKLKLEKVKPGPPLISGLGQTGLP